MGPPAAVAACRTAVRVAVRDLDPAERPLVLVAASGGPDSTALLDAACFALPPLGIGVGVVTVDHALQPGSGERARAVAAYAAGRGADPVAVWHVVVGGPGGPEAAARAARLGAFATAARAGRAAAVLLGHTRDDQAETVLLGLARGSGPRSLSGMAPRSGVLRRPFLSLPRATVAAAAAAAVGGPPLWDDPHNADPGFTRARVRHRVLPVLEAELGPGIAEALARTADLARADADALADLAETALVDLVGGAEVPGSLDVADLEDLSEALRSRVLRMWLIDSGARAGALGAAHVAQVSRLVTDWRGQGGVALPGAVEAVRERGMLCVRPTPPRKET
jgi:tRNA(Ile)-lysidine synthase